MSKDRPRDFAFLDNPYWTSIFAPSDLSRVLAAQLFYMPSGKRYQGNAGHDADINAFFHWSN